MTAIAPPILTLPNVGRFLVDTEHSAYIIDMDANTFERWPAAPEASTLHGDGTALRVQGVSCKVGEPMTVAWFDSDGHSGLRNTTPVVSIVPTP